MTGAWVAIALILLGLPVLAWAIGRHAGWRRLAPRADRDPWGDTVRRHRLSARDVVTVRQALAEGEQLDDARLRAAAVDWGQQELAASGPALPLWVRVLAIAWLAVVVVHTALLIAQGRWGEVNWVALVAAVGATVYLRRRQTRLRRAVALNGGPPGAAPEGAAQQA